VRKHGVLCIEGEWEADLRDNSSVQMLVEFLSVNYSLRPPIYRRSATKKELEFFCKKFGNYSDYNIGYFAFHGDKGKLCLGEHSIFLSELSTLLRGKCANKHLLLSSCQTVAVADDELDEFRKTTKARSVSGYRKSPDWIESAALDLLVMTSLLHFDMPSKAEEWLQENCTGLVRRYGFVMNYRSRG
jgi:hypothetical protein